jgi:acyl-CoA thioesterase I
LGIEFKMDKISRILQTVSLLIIFIFLPTSSQGGERVILCFGDSLTAGYGVPTPASYPARLQEKLFEEGYLYRVVNAGVSGDTTAGALSRLGWVMKSKPVIAIVTLGANDGLRGQDLGAMKRNLQKIIHKLQEADVKILLGGMMIPPNYGKEYTQQFARTYLDLALERDLPLIPFFLEGVAGETAFTLTDGIHPNEAGYGIILENVWKHLLPLLEE